jgi:hypothetical protein
MPKRVIDFDAMWGSDKLASCAEWAQAEYAWFTVWRTPRVASS